MSKLETQAMKQVEPQRHGSNIMVVDDDPIFRRTIRNYLEVVGHSVVEANDGLEALRLLPSTEPDLVLCDLTMPFLSGMEFAEEVSVAYPSLPVIVISATGDMADVAKALRFGVKDFLTKPIGNFKHLDQVIHSVLDDTATTQLNSDFVSRWFRLDDASTSEIADEQELHWHLQFLQHNPNAARELLTALLPDKDSAFGVWKSSYHILQATEQLPLVFDYSWLLSGQLAFYLVDSSSSEDGGVASTLLVRALFDDHIRRLGHNNIDIKSLAGDIEKGMNCANCAFPVDALFGVVELSSGTLSILPAGLDCRWVNQTAHYNIAGAKRLGEQCMSNFMTKDLVVDSNNKLTLSRLGSSSFSWTIGMNGNHHV
ncbi:response regulator [Vibrio hippocampi]|uniref:Regulator of RpoS n=1 Tax=Vibrio hippocampi TaxID=654686 RepID=A0ABN8DG86_9VIBR|nr:response regulator [Vibrio hippocampi]CAH0526564.1 Regulator of RpoS [Vibrio hippocampi]